MAFPASAPKKPMGIEETPEGMHESVVPKAPAIPQPTESSTKATVEAIQPVVLDDPDFAHVYGWNLTDLELTDVALNQTAKVPKCVQEYCDARGLVWRWLSYPNVKARGMRNYVALSMTAELRRKIKAGDCPPTVDIDVSNKLTWREDAFLGVMPRKLYDRIREATAVRVLEQTKRARGQGAVLKERAARAGGRIAEYSVDETTRQGL